MSSTIVREPQRRSGVVRAFVVLVSLVGMGVAVASSGACGGALADPCPPLDGAACSLGGMCAFVWAGGEQRCVRACDADQTCDGDLVPTTMGLVKMPHGMVETNDNPGSTCTCLGAPAGSR